MSERLLLRGPARQRQSSASLVSRQTVPVRRPSADPVLGLQRAVGNQAVQRLVRQGILRTDTLLGLQRTTSNQALQRAFAGPAAGGQDDLAERIRRASGQGTTLASDVRQRLESGLNANLAGVRLHTDSEADRLARAVDAVAFTSGSDIFFRSGEYDAASPRGLRLLAHETTHVVQQAAGRVAGTPAPGGVTISDPSDAFERAADATAFALVSDGGGQVGETGDAGKAGVAMQRRRADEPFASLPIQRQTVLTRTLRQTFGTTNQTRPVTPSRLGDEDIAERYAILTTALAKEQAERETARIDLIQSGATDQEAEALIAGTTIGEPHLLEVPEEYRPRRVTPAEKQIKRNEREVLEERAQDLARDQRLKQLEGEKPATDTDTVILKKRREYKARLAAARNDPAALARIQQEYQQFQAGPGVWVKAGAPAADRASATGLLGQHRGASGQREQGSSDIDAEAISKQASSGGPAPAQPGSKRIDGGKTETAATVLGGLSTVVGTGGGQATRLATKIAEQTKNTAVGGSSKTTPTGETIITKVGTAQQSGDVIGSAGDVLSLGNTVASLVGAVQKREGDPAQVAQSNDEIVDSVFGLSQGVVGLGNNACSLAGDFGGVALANTMAQNVLPGLGIVSAALSMIQAAKNLAGHAGRARAEKAHLDVAAKNKEIVLRTVIQHLYNRGVQLVAHSSVDLVANTLLALGDALVLSVVAAGAGAIVKTAAGILVGANKAAKTLIDSYRAGRAQATRREWQLAEPGSAEKLLADDPFHVAQTLVLLGRDGNPLALEELKHYGVTPEMLATSHPDNVRTLILRQIEESQNPKTVTQKLVGLKAVLDKIGSAAVSVLSRPKDIRDLAKAKNQIAYGGKRTRGLGWGIRQFFAGDLESQRANIHQVIAKDPHLGPEDREKLLYQTRDKAKDIGRPTSGGSISKPIHLMTKDELKAALEEPGLSPEARRLYEHYLARLGG